MKKLGLYVLSLALIFVFVPNLQADSTSDAQLTQLVENLQKQMIQMQRTMESQAREINSLKGNMGQPIVGAFDEKQTQSLIEASKWLEGLKFKGDLRLRYEAQDNENSSSTSTADRNRFRYRLRVGAEKKFSDEWKVGFRVVTGDVGGITSTNQTFDSNFGYTDIVLDRAYATYTPEWAMLVGKDEAGNATGIGLKGLEITAGKFENPFEWGSTKLVWDSDVTPEGIYEKFDFALLNGDIDLGFIATLGQLVIDETGGRRDQELIALQGGFHSEFKLGDTEFKTKHVVSYYDYQDLIVTAGDIDTLEVYNEIAFKPFEAMPGIKTYFDYAVNLAENAPTGSNPGDDTAWALGIKIGKAKKKGSWEAGYEYLRSEQHAVNNTFDDSDFGGTNRKGSILKGAYAITDDLTLGMAAFFTDTVSGAKDERGLYQVDLAWKF